MTTLSAKNNLGAFEGPPRILVVDDDPGNLNLLSDLLAQANYEVLTATNGSDGIQLAAEKAPGIILLDVFLPDIQGDKVCRMLKDNPSTRRMPVVMMTGRPDDEIKVRCLDAGAHDFLVKPVDAIELRLKLRNLMMFNKVARAKDEWEGTMDCVQDLVLLVDAGGCIRRCNKPVADFCNTVCSQVIGKNWYALFQEADLSIDIVEEHLLKAYHRRSGTRFEGALYPGRDELYVKSTIITLRNVTEIRNMTEALELKHCQLEQAYNDLKTAQSQIAQQEKMASIGQLAAGVAHEINNPTGFIMSNLGALQKYVDKLAEFIRIQHEALQALPAEDRAEVARQRKALKVDFITDDLRSLAKESLDGADRIKKIVQDLKSFSRVDEAEMRPADLNAGIESTINIVWNELKYKATLKKEYGDLPLLKCNPGQLNQVFMNILVNAAHAIEKQGEIRIRTWAENNMVHVSIADTGCGIPKDKLSRIFEPFFTTKEIGKGTGLGLSIAYDIVKKHNGTITVETEVDKGTTFILSLPVPGTPEGEQERGNG